MHKKKLGTVQENEMHSYVQEMRDEKINIQLLTIKLTEE
jgi:hypothetical protein